MDLLILCLGDLEDGLEMVREGDRVSSIDSLSGCSGEAGVVWAGSLLSSGEAVVGTTMVLAVAGTGEVLLGLN